MNTRRRAEAETIIHNALTRLSSARREKLSDQDYDVFADGLIEFPPHTVATVCEDLGREAPGEYEPRFPPLHVIRARCQRIVAQQIEARRRLSEPHLREQFPPLSPEKHAELMRKLIKPKVMR